MALSAEQNLSSMIDQAGNQRMLTQRILRDYVLVGMGVTYKSPDLDLADVTQKFDSQLESLKQASISDKVHAAFSTVDDVWQKVASVVHHKPGKEGIVELVGNVDDLLAKSHEAVLLLQQAAGTQTAEIVNISGRQRMLSQRMAALYMLFLWDIPERDYYKAFQQVVAEFQQAENLLLKSPKTTPAIRAELKKASKLFRWFLKSSQKKSTHMTPEVLQRNSDGLLEIMKKVTSMYVEK
jgi:hypothetical protein